MYTAYSRIIVITDLCAYAFKCVITSKAIPIAVQNYSMSPYTASLYIGMITIVYHVKVFPTSWKLEKTLKIEVRLHVQRYILVFCMYRVKYNLPSFENSFFLSALPFPTDLASECKTIKYWFSVVLKVDGHSIILFKCKSNAKLKFWQHFIICFCFSSLKQINYVSQYM